MSGEWLVMILVPAALMVAALGLERFERRLLGPTRLDLEEELLMDRRDPAWRPGPTT